MTSLAGLTTCSPTTRSSRRRPGVRRARSRSPSRRARSSRRRSRRSTARRPVVLAVPTGVEAERLAADLREFLGDDAVELFPAWETLPFERVSPAIETMGRRLRVIWRLRAGGDHLPAVVVAPVRALVQRLGPHVEDVEPDRRHARARSSTATSSSSGSSTLGYRREYQVEARGEVAVARLDRRRVSRRPPTTRCASICGATRSTGSRSSRSPTSARPSTSPTSWIFPVRELLPTDEVRARAARAAARRSRGGASSGSGSPRAQTFDGMESWLPWLTRRRAPAARPAAGERARRARRAAPPARPRAGAARRGGRARADARDDVGRARSTRADTPRLSLPFDRLLAHTKAQTVPVLAAPDSPDTPVLAASAFDPVVGDTDALGAAAQRAASATATACSSRPRAPASRTASSSCSPTRASPSTASPTIADRARCSQRRACTSSSRRSTAAWCCPAQQLALVAEADLTGRRRVHRRPRGARKGADYYEGLTHRRLRRAPRARRRPLPRHGDAEMFGITRDRLVVEFKGGDRVYVDSEDIGLIRKYTGGEAPKLSKMGGADWEKTRGRVRNAVRDIAGELVVLYRRRLATPGHAFAADTPVPARRSRTRSRTRRRPTRPRRSIETKADMERPVPMDRLVCGDVGYGKTEVALRAAAKAVFDGKQVAILVPTTLLASQHGQTFRERFANYPVRVEVLSRFLSAKEQTEVVRGVQRRHRRHRHRHAPAALATTCAFKDLGLLVVDEEQRFGVTAQGEDQGVAHRRRRADAHRDADPAHARDVAHRHPRPLAREHAARGSPADPHLRRRVRRARRVARRSAASCCARARCSTCTTACRTSSTSPPTCAARARSARRDRARADGRGPARARRAGVLGARARRARVHDDRRERSRHADGEHARRRPRRPARARAAVPAARPRRPPRAARVRVPAAIRATAR